MGLVREPFEVPTDADVVTAVVEAAGGAEIYGDTPWMDAALTQAAGIPTVVFGPHGAGAHAVEEWVDLASVETCVRVFADTARRICG